MSAGALFNERNAELTSKVRNFAPAWLKNSLNSVTNYTRVIPFKKCQVIFIEQIFRAKGD